MKKYKIKNKEIAKVSSIFFAFLLLLSYVELTERFVFNPNSIVQPNDDVLTTGWPTVLNQRKRVK